MKTAKRITSVFLVLVLVLSMLSTAAFAAGSDYSTRLLVEKTGTDTVDVKWMVQTSNGAVLKTVSSIIFKYDNTQYDMLTNDGTVITTKTMSDNLFDHYMDEEDTQIVTTLNSPTTWNNSGIYTEAKDNSTFVLINLASGSPTKTKEYTTETALAVIHLKLKSGTVDAGLPGGSIALATKDEANNCSQSGIVIFIGAGEELFIYGKTDPGATDSLLTTPTVEAGTGVTFVKPEYSGSVSAPTVTKNKGGAVELQTITITGETVEYGYSETNSAASVTNWQTSTTFNGLTVGKTLYFFARVTETAEHQAKTSDGTSVTVADKEMPTCNAPTSVTATYGQKLNEITLTNPGGNTAGTWSWMDGTQSVGNVGEKTFKAKFAPTDTDTYQTVSNIDVTVKVNPKSITPTIADISDQEYTGSAITPTVTVTADDKPLVKGTDYTVDYSNNINKGTATVTVKAKSGSNYTFSNVTKNFTIVGKAGKITFADGSYNIPYDGAVVTAGNSGTDLIYTYVGDGSVTVKWYADNGGSKGSELSGGAPKDAGIYWIGVSASAGTNYGAVAEVTHSFTITPKSINGATITLGTQKVYNGSAQDVVITSVIVDGKTLTSGTDYDITAGGNATNAGNTTLIITGKGNYTGTASTPWSLQKATPEAGDFTPPTLNGSGYDYDQQAWDNVPMNVMSGKNGIGERTVYYEGISPTVYAKSTTAPTDAGSYTVTFDVAAGTNYNAATGLSIGMLTINKVAYTGTNTVSDTVRSGQVNTDVTLTLPALPTGASYGTVSASGDLIDGTPTVSGTTLTYSTTSQTDGTTATITIPVTGATNYNDYNVVVTITAEDKTELTISGVTMGKSSYTYGGTPVSYNNEGLSVTCSTPFTFDNNTLKYIYSGTPADGSTFASGTTAPTKAGSYKLTVQVPDSNPNYMGKQEIDFSIGKKSVTVEAGTYKVSKKYDGYLTAGTASGTLSVSGILDADSGVTVQATPVAYTSNGVGVQTIMNVNIELDGTGKENYKIKDDATTVTVPCEITARPITIAGATATNRDYEAGNVSVETDVTFTDTIGTLTKGSDYTVTGTMDNANAGSGKTVNVTVTLTNDNYSLAANTTTTTVTINKIAYAGSTSTTGSAKYGATGSVELSSYLKDGYVIGTITKTKESIFESNPSMDGTSLKFTFTNVSGNAGQTAEITVPVTSTTNYNSYDIKVAVTVNAKTVPTVTAPVAKTNLTYDGTAQALISAGATNGGEMQYSLTSGSDYGTAIPTATNAGTYTVYYKVVGDSVYADVVESSVSVTIAKKDVTVAPKSFTITKGSAIPTFEMVYTGLVSGDTLTPSVTPDFTCFETDGTTPVSTTTAAGTYTITWTNEGATTFTGADNYNVTKTATGTLTINNPAPSGGGGVSTYSITAESAEHGTVSVSRKNASKGTTVTVTVKPDEGYELDALTVTNGSGKAVTVTEKDGKYAFTMPASKVSVKATFKEAEKPVTMPFTDVAEGAWYYDSIKYVYSNGMMVGTGDTKFSPNATTTRGMIVTILYRLEGEPVVSGASSFNDVAEGEWYSAAVKWAAENEIVSGYGNGQFGPEDPITREQMAAILYHYATFKDFDMTKMADLSKFTDSGKISDWSKAALSWANAEGLVNGKGGGILDPLGKATRAEIATILRNFCENVVK